MASPATSPRSDRPSFASIAAAGMKPPSVPTNVSNSASTNEKRNITSSPRNGSDSAITSTTPSAAVDGTTGKIKQLVFKTSKEQGPDGAKGPRVQVEDVEHGATTSGGADAANNGSLMPSTTDEAATQVSSSSDSGKPASLDGKSIISSATFALDEKESLRPDDSASLKGGEDDEVFSPPSTGLPSSRVGSEDGYKAFRDQLQEITTMNPPPTSDVPPSRPSGSEGQPKGVLYVPPPGSGVGIVPAARPSSARADGNTPQGPDPKLLEALESPRDRIWVLKLEQDIIDFVKDPKESSLSLPQCNSFYRLLAHKIADYYCLGHLVDDVQSSVRLFKTPECRIPQPLTGIPTPSTAASTPPPQGPQMKILRRGGPPSLATSKATSETGDSEDDKPKAPMSREEREARYEAARARIMGSAGAQDNIEQPNTIDSRSSSAQAQAKKNKKKQRSDSEDGFEARSAFNAFYAPPMSAGGLAANSAVYNNFSGASSGQQSPVVYGAQNFAGQVPQYGPSGVGNTAWQGQGYQQMDQSQAWAHGQQQTPYDMSAEFQRMSMQQHGNQSQVQGMSSPYQSGYMQQQQLYMQQSQWQPQQQMQPQQQQWAQYGPQTAFTPNQQYHGFAQAPYPRPTSSSSQSSQPYAYGQLPSQTFPGRLPSNMEHPIPGSFKSQHFNPQSQTFVPNGHNPSPALPYSPQRIPSTSSGYGGAQYSPQVQRQQLQYQPHQQPQQQPAPQQHQQYQQAYTSLPVNTPNSRPLTHPLPAPVFPRQPSPNLSLPPKPQGSLPQQQQQQSSGPTIARSTVSSAAPHGLQTKWAAPPASLPAKPPPALGVTAEGLDAARFHQGVGMSMGGNGTVGGAMSGMGGRQNSGYGSGGSGNGLNGMRGGT